MVIWSTDALIMYTFQILIFRFVRILMVRACTHRPHGPSCEIKYTSGSLFLFNIIPSSSRSLSFLYKLQSQPMYLSLGLLSIDDHALCTNSFNNKKVEKFVLFNGFIKLLMVTLDWGGEWLHVDVCCTHSADVWRLTSPHQDFWNKKPSCFQYNSSSGISENILIQGEVASLTSWCNVELSGCSLLSRKGHEINK